MKYLFAIATLLILTGASLFSGLVRIAEFDVRNEGAEFVVTWKTEVEEDVRSFEVQRRTATSNDQFVRVFEAPGHGPDRSYLFRDSQVFKSQADKLDYRLEVVYTNGVREVLRVQSMNYTSTAVRRTWGSLKAMFQ